MVCDQGVASATGVEEGLADGVIGAGVGEIRTQPLAKSSGSAGRKCELVSGGWLYGETYPGVPPPDSQARPANAIAAAIMAITAAVFMAGRSWLCRHRHTCRFVYLTAKPPHGSFPLLVNGRNGGLST